MEQQRYILETENHVQMGSRERSEVVVKHSRYADLITPTILASILACPKDTLSEIAIKHKIPVILDLDRPHKIVRYRLEFFMDLLKAMKEENIEANRRWLQELDLDSEGPIEVVFPYGKRFKFYQEKSLDQAQI